MNNELNKFEPSPPDSPPGPGRLSPLIIARIKKLSGSPTSKMVDEILKSAKKPLLESPVKPLSKVPSERSPRVKTQKLRLKTAVGDIRKRLRDMEKK